MSAKPKHRERRIKTIRRAVADGKAVVTISLAENGYLTRMKIDGELYDEVESYTVPDAEAWADILLSEVGGK